MTEFGITKHLPYGLGATLWVLVVLATILMTGCAHRVITTVEEVDAMVKAQVPIGSEREKVNSFIDTLKVGSLRITRGPIHSAEISLKYARTAPDRQKLEELDGRIAESGALVISDAETGFPHYQASIVIRFYVDKDGKVIDYTVTKEESE